MRQIAYCGDHTALVFTMWGDKIYVDTRDKSLAPHIMLEGDWEQWVTKCFLQQLSQLQGATVIDVGANFGWYTLLAAHFGAKHVFAFEPNLRPCNLMLDSVKVNGYGGRVTVLPMACGAARDMMRLVYEPDELGGARLLDPRVATADTDDTRVDTVPVVAIDQELGSNQIDPEAPLLIKIDVEGHEPAVVAGAWKTIEAKKPVLFIEHHRTDQARQMLENITKLGYSVHRATHAGHQGGALTLDQAMETGDAETLICEAPR